RFLVGHGGMGYLLNGSLEANKRSLIVTVEETFYVVGDSQLDDVVVGGTLDVTGAATFDTTLSVGTDLTVTKDATVGGALVASGLNYPIIDGTAGQVLVTDGSGNLSFDD